MSDKYKEIVTNVNRSFEEGKSEDFLSYCSDNISWTMVGEKKVSGKSEIREWMKQMDGMPPPEFNVKVLVAEGDTVVCSGDMKMKGPDGNVGEFGYCDIYTFVGDEISELTSFVVKAKTVDAVTK